MTFFRSKYLILTFNIVLRMHYILNLRTFFRFSFDNIDPHYKFIYCLFLYFLNTLLYTLLSYDLSFIILLF